MAIHYDARKVRWQVQGQGKRGGSRVVYVNFTAAELLLLAIYTKARRKTCTPMRLKGR